MRKKARLFAIAEYLRGRRSGVTAEQLAERFGVTLRTIYRDLESLREAELPVRADRGRGGGYALDRAYSLPPVNFNAREAALLIAVGNWATRMRLLPFADTLTSALDKVRGALSASAQRELIEHMEQLQFVGVPGLPVKPEIRHAVERAWFERVPLAIHYRRGDYVVTQRTVRIQGVLMERSITLLQCLDLELNERRDFRLDRIERAEVVRTAS
jgi:predicted DNA-binding transcriptional regulator YafY